MNWSWLMSGSASTYGPEIDRLYTIILVITGVVFVLTEVCLVWFLFRYRHKEGRKAAYIHGSTKAEIVWTAVPFVIVLWIALSGRDLWGRIKDVDRSPPDAMEVMVTAKQFDWNVTYPGADGRLGTGDDFSERNRLDVPVDRPVKLVLMADDVIHSFFLPDFRVKQDVVPGMEGNAWFQATRTGEFPIGCAELCGIGHTRMRGTLTVHSAADYQGWTTERIQAQQQQ